jgi:hypothetical protein
MVLFGLRTSVIFGPGVEMSKIGNLCSEMSVLILLCVCALMYGSLSNFALFPICLNLEMLFLQLCSSALRFAERIS